jgi:hypothetical protein
MNHILLTAIVAGSLATHGTAFSQIENRANPIVVAQNTGSCSGPGEQRFAYGTKMCFIGATYYQICTADGTASGLWKGTTERCPGH